MSKFKKLVSTMLALVMMLAMAIPAFATEKSAYSITIVNNKPGHIYYAYQVFAGDLSEDNVLGNIRWGNGLDSTKLMTVLKGIPEFKNCNTAADVAKVLGEVENDSVLAKKFAGVAYAAIINGNHSDASPDKPTNGKYVIPLTEPGYYLVRDSVFGAGYDSVTRVILKVAGNVEVTPKGDVPSVEKKVQEDDKYKQDGGYGQGYNDVADWNIGDNVPFKLIGTLPTNYDDYTHYKYVFHDTLSSGLTLNQDSIKVYVANDKKGTGKVLLTNNVDYKIGIAPTDSQKFAVEFADMKKVPSVTAGKFIIVEYTAKLNANAEIGRPGNPNEVYLEFSNDPNYKGETDPPIGKTPKDEVIVFTYELDTTKVDGTNETTTLKDAEFVLLNQAKDKVAKVDANGKFQGWVALPVNTTYEGWAAYNQTKKVILKSDAAGLFKVSGLDDGSYNLREIKAPAGYNLPEQDFAVVITATTANNQAWNGQAATALTKLDVTVDGKAGTTDLEDGTADIKIGNNKGATLPETGGMGTTLLYVLGGLLVVGTSVLLITQKRMSAAK